MNGMRLAGEQRSEPGFRLKAEVEFLDGPFSDQNDGGGAYDANAARGLDVLGDIDREDIRILLLQPAHDRRLFNPPGLEQSEELNADQKSNEEEDADDDPFMPDIP